jgi:uncharacterized protein
MAVTTDEGKQAVTIARHALEAHVSGRDVKQGKWEEGTFSELRGVFVTLNLAEERPDRLRGCIGFPYPVKPLGAAIQEATVAAASEDPRFPPVSKGELGSIVVEVSILTKPRRLEVPKLQDLPSKIRIGEDGLIVSRYGLSGLLLPQVATEFGMDQTEFLSQACMKAGLPPDSWLEPGTEVQTFQAEIFAEKSTGGRIEAINGSED